MAWRYQRTSMDVEVDLDDFKPEQLLQVLIDRKWMSEQEAEGIVKRSEAKDKSKGVVDKLPGIDNELLEIATHELRRGRRDEAIILLERCLGRDWIGAIH